MSPQPEARQDDSTATGPDWYLRRDELRPGMVFDAVDGRTVRLDRGVPGDGTRWYVDTWDNGWFSEGSTAEPADLVGEPRLEA